MRRKRKKDTLKEKCKVLTHVRTHPQELPSQKSEFQKMTMKMAKMAMKMAKNDH